MYHPRPPPLAKGPRWPDVTPITVLGKLGVQELVTPGAAFPQASAAFNMPATLGHTASGRDAKSPAHAPSASCGPPALQTGSRAHTPILARPRGL